MSFSHTYKTLRSGNTYKLLARPEVSAYEEDTTREVEIDASEQIDETNARISPDVAEERIEANFEPLHAQIPASTEMMHKLLQGNSAREFTTASTRELRPQSESPFAELN